MNPSSSNFQSTARIKINQIPCHFSSHESVFPSIVLWTKKAHQVQIFKFLSALMKVHPIPHASFETTRSRFTQILHHCSLYFLSQTLILWTKIAHRSEIFRLLSGWVKIHQIPCHV